MLRRTKIVTTLGPATDDPEALSALIAAGANTVRLNFSHGAPEEHIKRAELVRELAAKQGRYVAILGDLQGPKIRVAKFVDGAVQLQAGASFILDAEYDKGAGNADMVGLDYVDLPKDVAPDDILLLDDGRIRLEVSKVVGSQVITRVLVGGELSNNKGINRLGGGLSASALTDKDIADIKTAAQIGVDYLAVSFPRTSDDINRARALLREAGGHGGICAKIERAEAVATDIALDDIIHASDIVMVARGDLGVEIGDAQLVGKQKMIINRSRSLNKVVITATQMMESMIENSMPTRAEVMDVANAVLDGTDAVMLSAETAVGKYPIETVAAMADICRGAETHPSVTVSYHRIDQTFTSIAESTAMSAMYAANHLNGVTAIIALTESGHTAKLMSRITTALPIFALSRHQTTLAKTSLYRGVYPVFFDTRESGLDTLVADAIDVVKQRGHLQKGDYVIVTYGDVMGMIGSSNTVKVLQVS